VAGDPVSVVWTEAVWAAAASEAAAWAARAAVGWVAAWKEVTAETATGH